MQEFQSYLQVIMRHGKGFLDFLKQPAANGVRNKIEDVSKHAFVCIHGICHEQLLALRIVIG